MKKRFVVIAVISLLLLLTIAYFIPSYDQKIELILAPIIKPAQELNSPTEWQRWNPILKKDCIENAKACTIVDNRAQNNFIINTGKTSFTITTMGASYDITETGDGSPARYNYTLVSSIYNDSTTLIITEKTNLLASFFSHGRSNASMYADSLKSFIENPSAYYGFPLKPSAIIDTLVISYRKTILNNNPVAALKDMYKKLDGVMQADNLKMVRPRIAHFQPVGNDSVAINASIPVDKAIQGAEKNGITFMRMPPQGRMLIGYFKGRYGDRKKLYQAIERYLNDKLLKHAAANYEEYLSGLPENDNSIVEMNICTPFL